VIGLLEDGNIVTKKKKKKKEMVFWEASRGYELGDAKVDTKTRDDRDTE